MFPSGKLLKQTFTHRLTLLFLVGPALVVLMLSVLWRLDPAAMPRFSFPRLFIFYFGVVLWVTTTMYRLVARKWSVERWARNSLYSGSFHAILLGYACSACDKYWPAGALIYFSAIVAYVGYVNLTQTSVFILIFAASYLGPLYLEAPRVFQRDLVYNAAMLSSSGIVLFWIGLASRFYRAQDATIRGLLRDSRKDKRTIVAERAKSDGLLLSILPPSVAAELKETGRNEPVYYEQASVLFTDFQGFTRIAERLDPSELVGELDRCFSYFDSLMDRYQLEKLKTIGDSYMCVGGIPRANTTHAVDCVLAALEIQAFMNQMAEIKAGQGIDYWQLRLGIHSGPLVAGVIGEKKFAYDVWSDTVNTASRCESAGEPGRINISGETHALVERFFTCEYRGKVAAKNKGQVDMYFVLGIQSELSRDGEGRVPNETFQERYAALKTGMP